METVSENKTVNDNVTKENPTHGAIIDVGGLPVTFDSRVEKMVREKRTRVIKEREEAERQQRIYGYD